jgi:anti-sigma-K factor RskA
MYDDDQDALAAEYVLGTLAADERDQAEALIAIDPGFAELVRQWERRLGELNVMVEAVEPAQAVWAKIAAEIDGAVRSGEVTLPAVEDAAPLSASEPTPDLAPQLPSAETSAPEFEREPEPIPDAVMAELAASLEAPPPEPDVKAASAPQPERPSPLPEPTVERSADVIYLARGVAHWRRLTFALGALAAVLAIYIAVAQFAPGLVPPGRQAVPQVAAKVQPPPDRLVAALNQEPTAPAFLLSIDPQSRVLTVRTVSATPEAGRSYELWLISSKFPKPRSLGVVGAEEFTRRPIPPNVDTNTIRGASYAVSLEPAGGSPSGVPTGPILFTGKVVDALPGSPS